MYFLTEAFSNLSKSKGNVLLTIITIFVSLFLMEIFLLVNVNLHQVETRLQANVQVEIFLQEESDERDEEQLLNLLETSPLVEEYHFFSKDEAKKFFLEKNGNLESTLSLFDENPLPDSYEVELHKGVHQEDVAAFVHQLKENNSVESVNYTSEWVERFNTVLTIVRSVFNIFTLCLVIGSVFIIYNTIKLSLHSREREIEIMLFVGASYSFIIVPYLIEGIIQGILGSLLSLSGLYGVFQYVHLAVGSTISQFTGGYEMRFFKLNECGYLLLFGATLGLVGSFLAVRRVVFGERNETG